MLTRGLYSNDRTFRLRVLKSSLIFKPFKELLSFWCDTCMYSKDPNVKRNFHKSRWGGGIICIHEWNPSVVMKTMCEFQLWTHPAHSGFVTSATQEASHVQINSPGWMLNRSWDDCLPLPPKLISPSCPHWHTHVHKYLHLSLSHLHGRGRADRGRGVSAMKEFIILKCQRSSWGRGGQNKHGGCRRVVLHLSGYWLAAKSSSRPGNFLCSRHLCVALPLNAF